MPDEVARFDPTKLIDDVRARVQATFALMIPEAEWRSLVEREIKVFLRGDEAAGKSSGLRRIVTSELDAFFRARIKEELGKPEWSAQYVNGVAQSSEQLKELMIESAPRLFAATFGAMFQQALENLKYQR